MNALFLNDFSLDLNLDEPPTLSQIRAVSPLDYETLTNYRLVVRVQDGGSPSKSNTTNVIVNILDINDNDPRFYATEFHETVSENVEKGHNVIQVQAFDTDAADNAKITYSLITVDGSDPEVLPVFIEPETGYVSSSAVFSPTLVPAGPSSRRRNASRGNPVEFSGSPASSSEVEIEPEITQRSSFNFETPFLRRFESRLCSITKTRQTTNSL